MIEIQVRVAEVSRLIEGWLDAGGMLAVFRASLSIAGSGRCRIA